MSDNVRKKWRLTLSSEVGVNEERVRLVVNLLLMNDIDALVPNELGQMLEKAYSGEKHLMLKSFYFHPLGLNSFANTSPKRWK